MKGGLSLVKAYVCKYGTFFEGQILDKYITEKGIFLFQEKVYIKKFVIHYHNGNPFLYFQFGNFRNKNIYSINSDQLGIYYKIP